MRKVPFKRFVLTFLLFNKNVDFIIKKLSEFHYQINADEVGKIFLELRESLPDKYKDQVEKKIVFDINDPGHVEWLNHFGVFEFYDYTVRNSKISEEDAPNYFKWCNDCMWIHGYIDVMVLVNILLFNEEKYEEISNIITFKYKRKIGVDALALYHKVFWNTEDVSAKEASYFCTPFRDNTLIVRKLRSGNEIEVHRDNENNDGSDIPFTFHDSSYIKWKIGYREIEVPTPRLFLERVKQDSYFKYYEAMNMTQSIEMEEENGSNDKIGAFNSTKSKKRNVEEQRAKMAKQWLDMYLKAEGSIPKEGGEQQASFFEKMRQLELDFSESSEKLANIDDMKDVLDDISGDM